MPFFYKSSGNSLSQLSLHFLNCSSVAFGIERGKPEYGQNNEAPSQDNLTSINQPVKGEYTYDHSFHGTHVATFFTFLADGS